MYLVSYQTSPRLAVPVRAILVPPPVLLSFYSVPLEHNGVEGKSVLPTTGFPLERLLLIDAKLVSRTL